MAFNPFETFSVRSRTGKSVLAVLTIVTMFMFVLSSGAVGSGMDIFDQLGSLFGSKRGRGDVIATAYGDKIRDSDLSEARRQRTAAREYLTRAVEMSYAKWAKDLDADVKSGRLTGDVKDVVGRFAGLRVKSDTDRRAYEGYLFQFVNQQFGQEFFKFWNAWRAAQTKADSDDKRAMDAMVALMVHDLGLSPLYLVPLATESDGDVLDFILLLKKADKLGIHYSTDGVKELVTRDTSGRLTEDDYRKIEGDLRAGGRAGTVSSEWLAAAVANEYRAKVALAAIEGKPYVTEMVRMRREQTFQMFSRLGVDLGSARLPGEPATETALAGGLTPYEFFQFYKDQCSEHSFAVLQVNADAYLDQVKEQPTKTELNALFAKYRGELPDPSRDRPGFKEPRKVKVEYVSLDATAPRIAQAVPKAEAAGTFLAATTAVLTGDPMAALVNAARPDVAAGSPLAPVDQAARARARAQVEASQGPYQDIERFYFRPRDPSIYRPQPIVSALGMLSGPPDLTTVLGAMAAVHQQVERLDHQARVPFLLQPVLTPFNPTLANALGMPALALAHTPKAPPESLYLAEATAAARKDQLRNLFLSDVHELREKLRTLAGGDDPLAGIPGMPKPDKAKLEKGREEAKKYLADWLQARGLTPAGNKAPVDQWAVAADPDLKPLNDLAKAGPDGTNDLARRLFPDPQQSRFMDETKPFAPFWFPADPAGESADKPTHLVWQTEETQAVAYNNLDNADRITKGEMTRRVEAAWRLEKARALARPHADRVAEKVKEIAKASPGNQVAIEMQLRDLAAQKKLREFDLDRLALLKFEHGLNPNQQEYRPSTVDKSQVLYPTPDFVPRLLELRKEPVGAVTVLPDAPRTHFYVACLVAKHEKTVDQFRDVFDKASATGMGRNPLYTQYALPEEQGRAMNDTRLRLRADAGLDTKEAFTKRDRREEE